jgi:hypothetical protein
VAAEAGVEVGAGFDGFQQRKAVDGAAGAVGDAVFHADDDGRLGGAVDDARGENADDAAMPSFAGHDEHFAAGELGGSVARRARLCAGRVASASRRSVLRRSSLEASSVGAGGVAGGEELDDFGGDVHAAGGVDARAEAESEVEAGESVWPRGR